MPHNKPFTLPNQAYSLDSTQPDSDLINQNLYLLRLALHLMPASDPSKKIDRIIYSKNIGKTHKITHRDMTPVSLDEAKKRHTHRRLLESKPAMQSEKSSPKIAQEQLKQSLQEPQTDLQITQEKIAQEPKVLKKLTPEDLKLLIEFQKKIYEESGQKIAGVDAEIDGVDFSGMDLSGFNLNNLIFTNSNFKNTKLPSMTSVTFANNCNLENSDWSNTVQKTVQFGGYAHTKNSEKLIEAINQLELLSSGNESSFDDIGALQSVRLESSKKDLATIQKSVDELTLSTIHKPPTLQVTNANFAGTKFESFFTYNDVDFSGSNFAGAVFKITKAERTLSFHSRLALGIDLTSATLEFFDNQGKKTGESRGNKSLDLVSIDENARESIGGGGIMSQEYYDKLISGQEIIIKINAKTADIPNGLLYQSISDKVTTSSKLTAEKINEIQDQAIKIGDEYFGRYNIKFVTAKTIGDKIPDYTIHINLVSGIGSARADGDNSLALNPKNGLIAMDEDELGRGFSSILSHELGHLLLFQHPLNSAHSKLPSHMSYLLPMAQSPTDDGKNIVAKNIIVFGGFTAIDQKLIEEYMEKLGREPKIEKDLVSDLNLETFGVISSYNPDADFNNIVKIPTAIINENYRIVLINANDALAYCKTHDLSQCETANGLENSHAVMIMNFATKKVESMVILSGENPKIKIGEGDIKDVKELLYESGFSVIDSSQSNGEIMVYKYAKESSSGLQIFKESKSLSTFDDPSSSVKDEFFSDNAGSQKTHKFASEIGNYLGISSLIIASIGVISCISRDNRKSSLVKMSAEKIDSDSIKSHNL